MEQAMNGGNFQSDSTIWGDAQCPTDAHILLVIMIKNDMKMLKIFNLCVVFLYDY